VELFFSKIRVVELFVSKIRVVELFFFKNTGRGIIFFKNTGRGVVWVEKRKCRLIQYFYRIGFHESQVKTHEKSSRIHLFISLIFIKYECRLVKNTLKTFIELTPDQIRSEKDRERKKVQN
jgi:hypothetical protein